MKKDWAPMTLGAVKTSHSPQASHWVTSLSFSPSFSLGSRASHSPQASAWGYEPLILGNRFNGLGNALITKPELRKREAIPRFANKPLKRFRGSAHPDDPKLKLGENERGCHMVQKFYLFVATGSVVGNASFSERTFSCLRNSSIGTFAFVRNSICTGLSGKRSK